jgi:hypothetical protein
MPLAAVRPSQVRSWTGRLRKEGPAVSYVYALGARLSQIMGDAVHDGIIPRNPCSRRTSPGAGEQRAHVAKTEQIWAVCEAMPERYRTSILLGAFVGLRLAETYSHLWLDRDESARSTVAAVLADRAGLADSVRTAGRTR